MKPINKKSSILIIGPGGVGGFLACLFWKVGFQVTCLCSERSYSLLEKEGFHLKSRRFGNFTAHPSCVKTLSFKPDLVVIATKSSGLKDALTSIDLDYLKEVPVIPLLNGFEHLELLRKSFHLTALMATIGQLEAFREKPNIFIHGTPSAVVTLSNEVDINKAVFESVVEVFKALGLEVVIKTTDREVIWDKLTRLNAIACTTAAYLKNVGEIRSDPTLLKQLRTVLQEGAAVAKADGVIVNVEKEMQKVLKVHEHMKTSLHRDVERGDIGELDSLAGAIIRKGNQYHLQCPELEKMVKKVRDNVFKSVRR